MRGWGAFAASAVLHALVLGVLVLTGTPGGGRIALRVKVAHPSPPAVLPAPAPSPPPVSSVQPDQGAARGMPPSGEPVGAPEPGSPDPVGSEPAPVATPVPDRPARLVGPLEPPYPREARKRGWEGSVGLQVSVDAQGRVDAVQVRASSGRGSLDRAAVEAVETASFLPALHEGVATASTLTVTVHFRLQ